MTTNGTLSSVPWVDPTPISRYESGEESSFLRVDLPDRERLPWWVRLLVNPWSWFVLAFLLGAAVTEMAVRWKERP